MPPPSAVSARGPKSCDVPSAMAWLGSISKQDKFSKLGGGMKVSCVCVCSDLIVEIVPPEQDVRHHQSTKFGTSIFDVRV